MSSKDLNLVVTLGGRPVPDQALGIRAFKDACLAASKTPPAQAGEWTLTAPDGRTWKADSPLKCCGLEQRERVPASVALARIVEEMERHDAEEAAKAASSQETRPADLWPKCPTCKQPIYANHECVGMKPAADICPTTGQLHQDERHCIYCHIGNLHRDAP